ncbi:MAG: 50S ribosomal protein L18 [Patescibacteria group bacterium]|jgi:large subunit ribosomal protein L18
MHNTQQAKRNKRIVRSRRVRAKIHGTADKPRASIFRSLRHTYVQLINDDLGKTLLSVDDTAIKAAQGQKKVDHSKALGKAVAEKALASKISTIVFDRRGYRYHGRVAAVAEGMRDGGLKF